VPSVRPSGIEIFLPKKPQAESTQPAPNRPMHPTGFAALLLCLSLAPTPIGIPIPTVRVFVANLVAAGVVLSLTAARLPVLAVSATMSHTLTASIQ